MSQKNQNDLYDEELHTRSQYQRHECEHLSDMIQK